MDSNIKLTTKQAERKNENLQRSFWCCTNYKIHRYSQNAMRSRAGTWWEYVQMLWFLEQGQAMWKLCVRKSFDPKKQYTKLECLENNIYQIIAKYLEIDGVPCVMEMVHRLDNENLIDNDGRRILMDT